MTDPRLLSINDFTYALPDEKIARYPLPVRDASRLLIYKGGSITEDTYRHISTHIPAGSLVVFNNTKVIEARLLFQKPTGGVIEIFCLAPHEQYPDITTAMLQTNRVQWQCLVGGASKWKRGQILEKKITNGPLEITLHATYVEKRQDHFIIELSWSPSAMSFAEVLHHMGAIPLPPYIKRAVEASDNERYQTVYAHFDGSVAAPTAGLHFTDDVFNSFSNKNISGTFVTLHVGAGTFKPVKSATMAEHEMHAEFIEVNRTVIEQISNQLGKTIIAAGTTSLRTIESLYWLGVKSREQWAGGSRQKAGGSQQSAGGSQQEAIGSGQSAVGSQQWAGGSQQSTIGSRQEAVGLVMELGQWESYTLAQQDISPKDALQYLLDWMEKNNLEKLIAKTQIIIAPGYRPKIADALITNFHQPQSTLLLLVAALIGDDWRKVYDYALENDFRFLSYGDGSLLWVRKSM